MALEDRRIRVRYPARRETFVPSVKPGCTTQPANFPLSSGDLICGVKLPGREANLHSVPWLRMRGSTRPLPRKPLLLLYEWSSLPRNINFVEVSCYWCSLFSEMFLWNFKGLFANITWWIELCLQKMRTSAWIDSLWSGYNSDEGEKERI